MPSCWRCVHVRPHAVNSKQTVQPRTLAGRPSYVALRPGHPNWALSPMSPPAAACIRPSSTCVSGSYTVQTPGGPGCLSCFDTNVAVGPKCFYKGTTSCTQTTCVCNGQYKG